LSRFVIQLPKKLNRVEVQRTTDFSARETDEYFPLGFGKNNYGKSSRKTKKADNDNEVITKAVFSQDFSFPGSNEPVDISINELPTQFIPIETADKHKKEAYETGFSEGEEFAVNMYKNEIQSYQQWIKKIDSVVLEIKNQFTRELSLLEDSLPELAVLVAERIIEKETSSDSKIVIEQTRKAIQSLDNETIFKIHLNPGDISILAEVKSSLVEDSSRIQGAEIVANESVEPGFCLLETSVGNIDARMKTQLEILKTSLTETFKIDKIDTKIKEMEKQESGQEQTNADG
jgi:flagellar biosynthesis/type III secretory pathway protein FliH